MPQIIVTADHGAAFGEGAVTLRERVTVADFESQHFATQLVERLGWAVEDAHQAERLPAAEQPSATGDRRRAATERRRDGANGCPEVSEPSDDSASKLSSDLVSERVLA